MGEAGTPPITGSLGNELHAALQLDKIKVLIFQQSIPQSALMGQSLYIYRNGHDVLAKVI
jgi:hypothetical protein